MIPKKIYVCWSYKEGLLESQSPLILNGLRNLIDLNPDWEIQLFDDNDVNNYLKSTLGKEEYNAVKDVHIVEKIDTFRLLKLFFEGGMYTDIDRLNNIKLSSVIDDNTKCVLPFCQGHGFSQDIMISEPGNPVYSCTLNIIFNLRKQGYFQTYLLGPQAYMRGVTEALCNEQIDVNPGAEKLKLIKSKLDANSNTIKTYVENPPYDTIFYKHDLSTFKKGNSTLTTHEEIKREFYGGYNIRHWTNEW